MNDKTLVECGIEHKDRISLTAAGQKTINFTNFQENIIKETFIGTSKHLLIFPGLAFLTICKLENKCAVKGQRVCVNLGFGNEVRINEIYDELECPICKGPTELARTVLFFKTSYHIRAKNSEMKPALVLEQHGATEGNKYHTFAGDDQNITQWSYIKITTRPLPTD